MKKKYFALLFFSLCVFYNITLSAQDNYPDAGLWNTFSIEKELNTKFTALLAEEMRFKENFLRLNLFYTNIGIEYKFSSKLKTSLVYRWIDKFQDDNTFSYRNRLMWDVTLKDKFGKFTFSYRHRLQAEKRDIYVSKHGYFTEWYSRNKFDLKYDMNKPYTPYAKVELRYQIHDFRNFESESAWHRIRYYLGLDYQINKKNTFGAYYLIQREWNEPGPNNLYIIGLEYSLTL